MRLVTKGFKGKDTAAEISGAKIFVGPNGSGKSAINDALRFLALGFVPALGKRPQDTAALMPDDSREISVELSTEGGSCRRLLARKEKGFEAFASCSWLVNAKPSEQAKAITGLFGKEEVDVAEVLDLRELLNATPNQRAARLEALVAAGKRSADELLLAVKRLIVQRLGGIDDDRMAGIKDYKAALPMVPEKCLAVLEETAELLAAKVRDAGLAGALAWANEGKRLEAEGVNRREQAAKELRLRAAEVPEPDPKEIQALEAKRGELERSVGAVEQQAAGYSDRSAKRAAVIRAHAEAQAVNEAAQAAIKRAQEVDVPRLQELEAAVAAIPPEPVLQETPDDPRIRELFLESEVARNEAFKTSLLPVPSYAAEIQRVQGLEEKLAEAKASPWEAVLAIAERLAEVASSKGQKAKAAALLAELRAVVEQARDEEHTPAEIEEVLAAAKKSVDSVKAKAQEATQENAKIEAKRAALMQEAQEAQEKAHVLQEAIQDRHRAALASWGDLHETWERNRAQVRQEWQEVRNRLQAARERAQASTEAVQRAQALLDVQGAQETPPADPAPMREELGKLAGSLAALQSAAALFVEIQRAIEAIEGARARKDTFAAIEWALQRERQAELSRAGGAFLEIVAGFLKAGGRLEIPFIKAGAAIGWTRDGADILVQAMSGGEWALFVAAMTTAALILRDARIRILLVEADSMDDATLRSLVAGVVAFLPKLSGAIVTTWRRPSFEVAGVEIVDMGAALSPSPRG